MIIDFLPSLKLKTLLMAGTFLFTTATVSVEAVVVSSNTQMQSLPQALPQENIPTTGRLIIKYKNSAMQNSMSTMSTQSMQSLSRKAGVQMQHVRQMSSGAQVMKMDDTVSRDRSF